MFAGQKRSPTADAVLERHVSLERDLQRRSLRAAVHADPAENGSEANHFDWG
jgi:hypothetical protein